MDQAQSRTDKAKPRVFVFTDINIDAGDPDDRQSLVHLLWYADQLDIVGIVPDRWDAQGLEACRLAVRAYAKDFDRYRFGDSGYPDPNYLENLLATDLDDAMRLFARSVSDTTSPLYVLIWGNMVNVGKALRQSLRHLANVRLISIGTGLMYEKHMEYLPATWERSEPCIQLNWNGHGRKEIYTDSRFDDLWWLEINWTYNGMFTGKEPEAMLGKLAAFGEMGRHLVDVTANQPWARYFRVGDTPSVLYMIDPRHELDDPTQSSWAGRFKKALPEKRPNYYTDHNGSVEWDYADPCRTWHRHEAMYDHAKSTLEKERPGMYEALLKKLEALYEKSPGG